MQRGLGSGDQGHLNGQQISLGGFPGETSFSDERAASSACSFHWRHQHRSLSRLHFHLAEQATPCRKEYCKVACMADVKTIDLEGVNMESQR
mmetsp:Transcript_41220/g.89319  ORF Transcript_41220/g.89319 Transcript_41220/m.89319 type:complete len:92 (+) Transcript_41220:1754-2029(+)